MIKARGTNKKLSVKALPNEQRPIPYKKPLAIGRYAYGYFLIVRETSDKGEHELFSITSRDGVKFNSVPEKITLRYKDKTKEDLSRCRDFRLFSHEDEMVLTYTRREKADSKTGEENKASLIYAATKDRKNWVVAGVVKKIHSGGILVPEMTSDAGDTIYFGGDVLRTAVSKNTASWNIIEPHRVPHWHFFDGSAFRVISAVPLKNAMAHPSVAVFYEAEVAVDIMADINLNDTKVGEERFIKMGAALFSQEQPTRLLWQTELPLIELPLEKLGNFSIIGVVPADKKQNTLRIYGATQDGAVSYVEFSEKVLADHRERKPAALKKHPANPILTPVHHPEQKGHQWESDAAFNPAAVEIDGKVHLLYRAVGTDGLSRIGYASSKDGVAIAERSRKPIYSLDMKASKSKKDAQKSGTLADSLFHSGGSWGGSEDPKVSKIDDRIYLTYVAHNGTWPTRTAITSISVEDFLKKRWKWKRPEIMSPPNVGSKSVVILPERIDGKYIVFHRMWPNIMIDILPDLDFDSSSGKDRRWLTGQHMIRPRNSYWDSRKLSMGAAPIKTDAGWLAIYNAVDKRDSSKYKIGAMLLDLKDPRKVIARSRKPILSPDEWYENDGKPGVAYPGGAVDLNGLLHVYYGGGDKVGCVATIPTSELVWHLLRDSEPHMNILPAVIS